MIGFDLKEVKLRTREVMRAVKRASMLPQAKAAMLVERDAKLSMRAGGGRKATQGARQGRTARQGTPSEPGTPPNVQLGNLRSSITWSHDGPNTIVGPTEIYGAVHEQPGNDAAFAEFSGRNYPKRAFMRPALERMISKFAALWRSLRLRR